MGGRTEVWLRQASEEDDDEDDDQMGGGGCHRGRKTSTSLHQSENERKTDRNS